MSDQQTQIALLIERVNRLTTLLEGNGQPGFIDEVSKRLQELEEFKWKVIGALSLGGFLFTIVDVFVHWKMGLLRP